MKKCSCCLELKDESQFTKNNQAKDKLNYYCKICISNKRKTNKDKLKEYSKAYRKDNPNKINEYSRKWRLDNAEKMYAYQKKYKEKNPDKIKKILADYENTHKRRLYLAKKNISKAKTTNAKKRANIKLKLIESQKFSKKEIELLLSIYNFYLKFNKTPVKRDFKNYGEIISKFKTWNNALELIGLHKNRSVNLKEEDLIFSLKKFYDEFKKPPTCLDTNKCDYLFDKDTYLSVLKVKTWKDVLEKADLKPYFELNHLTKEEIQRKYIEISEENGFFNGATKRFLDKTDFSSSVYIKYFGSLTELRLACNYIPIVTKPKKYNYKTLEDRLYSIYLKENRIPTIKELKKYKDLPDILTLTKQFKTLSIVKMFNTIIQNKQNDRVRKH